MVNKLSDCSGTKYEVWSVSYQTVLLQYTRYGQYDIRLFCYRTRDMVNSYQTVLLLNMRYGQ